MAIQTPIIAEADPWPAVQTAVNAWRGQAIAHLGRAETSVSEALLALSQVRERGANIKLPYLTGERCKMLAEAIGPEGPFHTEGRDVREALDAYRAHASLRNSLCHAPGKITRDRNGRWLLVLKVLNFRTHRPERSIHVIDEAESGAVLDRLRIDCQRLANQLDGLRKKLV